MECREKKIENSQDENEKEEGEVKEMNQSKFSFNEKI